MKQLYTSTFYGLLLLIIPLLTSCEKDQILEYNSGNTSETTTVSYSSQTSAEKTSEMKLWPCGSEGKDVFFYIKENKQLKKLREENKIASFSIGYYNQPTVGKLKFANLVYDKEMKIYGVRAENMIAYKKKSENAYGFFYQVLLRKKGIFTPKISRHRITMSECSTDKYSSLEIGQKILKQILPK